MSYVSKNFSDSCVSINHRFASSGHEQNDPVYRGVLVLSCYSSNLYNDQVVGLPGSYLPYEKGVGSHTRYSFLYSCLSL